MHKLYQLMPRRPEFRVILIFPQNYINLTAKSIGMNGKRILSKNKLKYDMDLQECKKQIMMSMDYFNGSLLC